MKMIHMTVPGHDDATLEGYILDCEIKLGQSAKRPAIVVCPGGGYVYCSPREAEDVADAGYEFSRAKGLGDIVVGAKLKSR